MLKWSDGLDVTAEALPRIIVISGPTGVGKSELAVSLALHIGGEIINLDSVQVYRELEIGSAKPSLEERSIVPHHLFDCASIGEHFDVGTYRSLAAASIDAVIARGNVPILCGGTTMYLTVLLHGLMSTGAESRERPNKRLDRTTESLYQELTERDPVRAQQLHAHDRQRIGRALDLLDTGVIPSQLAQTHQFAQSHYEALILVKSAAREELYRRINARAEEMVRSGIIEETQRLYAQFGRVRALESVGYRQVLDWDGTDQEQLSAAIAMATRQFAKRQTTFWRNEPAKRGWAEGGYCAAGEAPQRVDAWLKSRSGTTQELLRLE